MATPEFPNAAKRHDRAAVYSNNQHVLDADVVDDLHNSPALVYGVHFAWDFIGYVWFDGQLWNEEIWVYGNAVEVMQNSQASLLIQAVNAKYGSK